MPRVSNKIVNGPARTGKKPVTFSLLQSALRLIRETSPDGFTRFSKAAALAPMRFHDLRHSAATLLLSQGVSPKNISDLLGHSQVSFTMQTYAHVLPHVQREVAAKMDQILNPVATTVATKQDSAKIN